MGRDVTFGYNVPVFAGGIQSPVYEQLSWADTHRVVRAADRLGFDSLWAPDHLMVGDDHAEYEVWTLLSAAAAMTEDVRLGTLVLCNDFRNPALVAKMAATLDVVSDGRVTVGLGAGHYQAEYESYGWEFRDGFTRLMRLDESIRLMEEMWTGDDPTFHGDHYRVEDAHCEPGPVQDPHPPVLVGGDGEEVTLKLVARHADVWNTTNLRGHPDTLAHKLDVLRDHCETVGRDVDDIETSWECLVCCRRDEAELDRLADRLLEVFCTRSGEGPVSTREDLREYLVFGTPEECAAALERRVDLGLSAFQGWFVDAPDTRGMELFVDEVAPAVE